MTEAQLYDLLQTYFGIGSHDDVMSERYAGEPWWQARATEIGKLKRLLKSRHVDVETMAQTAEYAHAHHLPITATWQLIEVIPDARRAARAVAQRPLSDRLQEATAQAVASGEMEWATRLSAATSNDVLNSWEASRG